MNSIKYIFLDVDGTLTDGGLYIDSNKQEMKKFCVQDGAGIILARAVGIECIILTGRSSKCVEQRAQELKIKYVYQGIKNKEKFVVDFINNEGLNKLEIGYIGDDLNDLYAMKNVGFVGCPKNAANEVKSISHYISSINGGSGAVRDCIEHILKQRNQWNLAIEKAFGSNQ